MAHRLHLLFRVDPRGPESELPVHGCVAFDGVRIITPVNPRGLDLSGDHRPLIDLTRARHLDAEALHRRRTPAMSTPHTVTATATSPHPRDWGRALAEAVSNLSCFHGGTEDEAAPALFDRGVHLSVRESGTEVEITVALGSAPATDAVPADTPAA